MAGIDQLSALLQRNLQQRINAPDFPLDADWLNVEKPLTRQALRGKVVLLDFWTFCCINCMHVIPELKHLEAKYPDELVVVGVHSAKFTNEKVTDQIRQSILRYEIAHPVLNDAGLELWSAYGVHAWPTLILIDPEGHVVLQTSGEGNGPLLDAAIQWLIHHHEGRKTLDRTPLPLQPETLGSMTAALQFPGKILVTGQEVLIADSNHNQILVADTQGRIRERIGTGSPGRRDGGFEDAQFYHPQGLARDGDQVYVADTENHLIRAVDLTQKTVRTIAGTGQQGLVLRHEAPAETTALNSPWDLVLVDGLLYIAMAGAHQIWSFDVQRGILNRYAGTGQEQILDGSLQLCALAQPSGITADPDGNLYIADSEISAVRKIDRQRGHMEILIGHGLFVFGDRDGPWKNARLQHPLGIVWHDGALYLTDSYNHKIKRLNLEDRTIETIAGTGTAGQGDGTPGQLAEPAGLDVFDGILYIADTNNHAIRLFNLREPGLSTLSLRNASRDLTDRTYTLPRRAVSPGSIDLAIYVSLPKDMHFAAGAPFEYSLTSATGRTRISPSTKTLPHPPDGIPIVVSFTPPIEGNDELIVTATVMYCDNTSPGLCHSQTVVARQPIEVRDGGLKRLGVSIDVAPAVNA